MRLEATLWSFRFTQYSAPVSPFHQRFEQDLSMSILVDKSTRVLVQGLGKAGTFHAKQCQEYGTAVVGATKPGKGGTTQDGFPLFNTVAEAVQKTGANASMIFVPPLGAADAIMEAADAGIGVIIAITEGIPVLDMA